MNAGPVARRGPGAAGAPLPGTARVSGTELARHPGPGRASGPGFAHDRGPESLRGRVPEPLPGRAPGSVPPELSPGVDTAPVPGPRPAVVAVATTREVLALPELHEGLLEAWELRRLAAARLPERRADALAARLLVRLCAARFTGLPVTGAAPAQWCPDCGRHGHGRPYLPGRPGTGVSLSHADGVVAAAVGPGPIGVDVEPAARRPGSVRVLRRLLPEAELRAAAALPDPGPELLRLWVRREALFKAGADVSPDRPAGDGSVRGWFPGDGSVRGVSPRDGRTHDPDRPTGRVSRSGPFRSVGDGRANGPDRPSDAFSGVGSEPSGAAPSGFEPSGPALSGFEPSGFDPFASDLSGADLSGSGFRSGLRLLEWTDLRRAAVAAVAGPGPVTVLTGLGPPGP